MHRTTTQLKANVQAGVAARISYSSKIAALQAALTVVQARANRSNALVVVEAGEVERERVASRNSTERYEGKVGELRQVVRVLNTSAMTSALEEAALEVKEGVLVRQESALVAKESEEQGEAKRAQHANMQYEEVLVVLLVGAVGVIVLIVVVAAGGRGGSGGGLYGLLLHLSGTSTSGRGVGQFEFDIPMILKPNSMPEYEMVSTSTVVNNANVEPGDIAEDGI